LLTDVAQHMMFKEDRDFMTAWLCHAAAPPSSLMKSRRFTASDSRGSTERIAHLGTADCCIHPPGRNEMIAITPPKIFSKEVAQKQATPFPRQDLLTARNRF